jgi:glucose/arabinose dehydrogenase
MLPKPEASRLSFIAVYAAPLGMVFNSATQFPQEYRNDAS